MLVGLEIGSKQKVLLKNSSLTFFWDDPITRDLSRVMSCYRYLSKKLIESLKKVNNYNEKYLINTLHGKVDNWTLKEVVRGHTAFHLNQFGVY